MIKARSMNRNRTSYIRISHLGAAAMSLAWLGGSLRLFKCSSRLFPQSARISSPQNRQRQLFNCQGYGYAQKARTVRDNYMRARLNGKRGVRGRREY